MPCKAKRDFIGYGGNPPDLRWPNGAHLAVNFAVNYEAGFDPWCRTAKASQRVG